jgi:stearoyl-CoA desaturase (delta-9 desaturase)
LAISPSRKKEARTMLDRTRSDQFVQLPNGRYRRLAVESEYLHRIQRTHFLLFDILPLLGTVVALALLFYRPLTWLDMTLFFIMWLLTGIGITAGYHRLFAHRSYRTSNAVSVMLVILGSMSGRGSMISWAAMHRRHHEVADKPGDMHSPNLHGDSFWQKVHGFLHSHYSWMVKHDYPNVAHYTPDLIRNQSLVWASRHYMTWVVLGLVIPTVIGGVASASWWGALTGFLWGAVVRMFIVEQSMSALNSFLHLIGSQPFKMDENSRNNMLLGALVWGEGWHNNHHAFPNSASFALKPYAFDLGYWFIRGLSALGLAWDVRVPTRDQIKTKIDRLETRPKLSSAAAGNSPEI